jgi:hypothetical protein
VLASTGVPRGPRIYRRRLRTLGPFAPLLPMAVLVLIGQWLLVGNDSLRRTALSLLLSLLALPFLLVFGVPLTSGPATIVMSVVCSAGLWMALGAVSAVRATRRPAVGWTEYWRELAWTAAAVWAGLGAGVLLVNLMLGRPLL